jgi:hypothetical protein
MGMPGNAQTGSLREHGARALVVLAVSAVVAAVAVGLLAAGADRVEVVATLLFIPVFAAGLFAGRSAAWVAAAVATIVYLALRSADVDDAGIASVALLAVTRAVAYAVAAEVGLRAQPVVDRLARGNEWDDSPLMARGRAFSRREGPRDDTFGAAQPTSVWVTTQADDSDVAESTYVGSPAPSTPAPVLADVGSPGSEWAEPLGPLASDPGWSPGPPARAPANGGWPPDPPRVSPPPWSDPYGSPAVEEADPNAWPPAARSPAPWSDPTGTPAVADPDDARPQRRAWHDAAVPPSPARPAPPPWRAASRRAPSAPAPPVDPETRLWTARFLCDRIASERAHCQRTGSPFSLVLVQVPDEPFALLPYRRQVTLLRELGHQFVAGGVVDHLVHVPDQTQHWFAVVLPDVDRASAQVLERRLRLGIGGYLRSRGLPLAELESASLTTPDDDPALGAVWDALAGRGDPASAGSSSGVLAY